MYVNVVSRSFLNFQKCLRVSRLRRLPVALIASQIHDKPSKFIILNGHNRGLAARLTFSVATAERRRFIYSYSWPLNDSRVNSNVDSFVSPTD